MMAEEHRKGDPPYIYLHIHSKLKERARGETFILPSFILEVMRNIIRVPRTLHYPILYQMEEYKLIRKVNQQKFEILSSPYEKILPKLRFPFW